MKFYSKQPKFIKSVLTWFDEGLSALEIGRRLGTSHSPVRTVLKANDRKYHMALHSRMSQLYQQEHFPRLVATS